MTLENVFCRQVWVGFFVAVAGASSAFAQSPAPERGGADPATVPVRAAAVQHAVGEEVVSENGTVSADFFVESRICNIKGCRSYIFDTRSGALIKNDRVWSDAYALTGRGKQVIRIKPFTSAERPKPAPSDKALETAPGIIAVKRPKPDNGK